MESTSETVSKRVDRSPFVAFMLAVFFAVCGYLFLTQGALLLGAFYCWACGVNCGRLASKLKSSQGNERL